MNQAELQAPATGATDTRVAAAAELQDFVLQHIPLARAMQLRITDWQDDHIELVAPLAPNINDKGCAFGGSLSSVMTLAPWALLELHLRRLGIDADLFVASAEIRYRAPIFEDIRVRAELDEGQDLARFEKVLRQRGRARIGMVAVVDGANGPACIQHASYAARLRT